MAPGLGIHKIRGPFRQFVGLLDQSFASGATAAYSLRRLKSSATKAVRVREDSGNTETDIGFSGGALDETALLNHVGSNNGFVTKWYDQSGNGNDASNSTASEQPQIVNSGSVITESKNGKPALQFNNAQYLAKDSMSGALVEYYEVIKQNEGGTTRKRQILFSDQYKSGTYFLGAAREGDSSTKIDNNVGTPTHTFLKSSNPSTRDEYYKALEDILELVNIYNISNLSSGFEYGISGYSTNGWYLSGKVQEIIAYPSNKSTSKRSSIKNNIDNFYSIT